VRGRGLAAAALAVLGGLGAAPAAGQGAAADARGVHLDLRLSAFEMTGAADSWDAVFGDPMLQGGLGLEWRFARRFLLLATADYGVASGEQVLLADPPVPTGVDVELTYLPVHLSAAWIANPSSAWRLALGGGPSLVSWDDDSGTGTSATDTGAHALAQLRRTGGRFSWGAELRWSTIPDAVGDGGVTAFYDEDDIGGIALTLFAGWRP
jgi:hypothetical protein